MFRSLRLHLIWGMQKTYYSEEEFGETMDYNAIGGGANRKDSYMESESDQFGSGRNSVYNRPRGSSKFVSLGLSGARKSRVKPSSTYFIKERNLIKWLTVIMVPLVIGIIVALFDKSFAIWLPSFSMYQCGNW